MKSCTVIGQNLSVYFSKMACLTTKEFLDLNNDVDDMFSWCFPNILKMSFNAIKAKWLMNCAIFPIKLSVFLKSGSIYR